MARLHISLAQMNIVAGEVKRNTATMEKMLVEAARRGSYLVVFPELWSTGYVLEDAREHANTLNAGIFNQLSSVTTQNKISMVGSVLEKRGLEVANSAAFFAPNGRMLGVYRKIHLFPGLDEDKYLQPGASPLIINAPWGRTAFAICYDLRFPELFRRYRLEDASVVIVVAEWPQERIEHWRVLLQARAIENQVYIIACNAAGRCGDMVAGGHSMVVDPWGKILIEASDEPGLFSVDIEMDRVEEARKRMPVMDDRRPETYETLDLGY